MCVAGARPNFMKVAPVVRSLEARGFDTVLCHTGQHYDAAMSGTFFDDLGLRRPDISLEVGSGTHAEQTGRVMVAFEQVLGETTVDAVVVVGDVNSTVACALVTAKAGPVLAHVEAGLRSRDWAMPEEVNRVVTDRVSDLLLAPSEDATDNLRSEGYRDDQIVLVGNVMIDSLLDSLDRALARPIHDELALSPGGYGLVTLHRPANVDDPLVLGPILRALSEITADLPLVFPVHPRTRSKLAEFGPIGGLMAIEPQGYLDFLALEAKAALVLTDSGGVQEETTALGVPCLTLRENTERPITISEGTNRVVGTDPGRIVAAAREVLASPPPARRPELWDGRASDRIVDAIITVVESGSSWRRPTDLEPT